MKTRLPTIAHQSLVSADIFAKRDDHPDALADSSLSIAPNVRGKFMLGIGWDLT